MDKNFLTTFTIFSLTYLLIGILFWFLPTYIINKLFIIYLIILPVISIVLGITFLFINKKQYAYGCFASLISAIIIAIIEMGMGFGSSIGSFM